MLESFRTSQFKREFALSERRGKSMDKLIEVMDMIINEQPLPERRCNHPLHGKEYEGKWECCYPATPDSLIEPDWLVVYKINPEVGTVTFHRTGTHSDFF